MKRYIFAGITKKRKIVVLATECGEPIDSTLPGGVHPFWRACPYTSLMIEAGSFKAPQGEEQGVDLVKLTRESPEIEILKKVANDPQFQSGDISALLENRWAERRILAARAILESVSRLRPAIILIQEKKNTSEMVLQHE